MSRKSPPFLAIPNPITTPSASNSSASLLTPPEHPSSLTKVIAPLSHPLHSHTPLPHDVAMQPPLPALSLLIRVFRGGKKKKKKKEKGTTKSWEPHPTEAADAKRLLLQQEELFETARATPGTPAKKELRFAAKIAAAMDADGFVGVRECLTAEEERSCAAIDKEAQIYSMPSSVITESGHRRASRPRRRRCKLLLRIAKTPLFISFLLRKLDKSIATLRNGLRLKNRSSSNMDKSTNVE